ncbi:MAG: hypothetical protein LBE74_07490 [Treponema sp.]|jgi:hypothetical protein|nr:hypothetical protein [Treponema sp.]
MKIDVSTILNAKTLNTRAEIEDFVRKAFAPSFQSEKDEAVEKGARVKMQRRKVNGEE